MSARLHVVTGKGGTGKTTVAVALALALARGGRSVLLVEVEGRQGVAAALGAPPLGTAERVLATVLGGGAVHGLAVDATTSLAEYLTQVARLGPGAALLEKVGAVELATSIAPGLRDVLLVGKVYEAVRRTPDHPRTSGAEQYDAVVLDAPPTGRITRFLTANEDLAALAKAGPIRSQADSVAEVLRSCATAVHVVTMLEAMPVREAVEGVGELRAAGLPVADVVVNRRRAEVETDADLQALLAVTSGDVDDAALACVLNDLGVDLPTAPLLDLARTHVERLAAEDDLLAELEPLDLPVLDLPELPGPLDRRALDGLGALLAEDLA